MLSSSFLLVDVYLPPRRTTTEPRYVCVGDQKDVYVRAPGWPTGAIGGLDKYNNTPLPRNWADDLVANHLSR